MTPNTPAQTPEAETIGTMTSHAKTAPRAEGLVAAWLTLIIAGIATVTFNLDHAFASGLLWPLAIVEGVAPVALAMVISHLVATCRAGRFLRGVTFAVMIGAMVLSVRATGTVIAPAAGPLWWVFGAVTDTAALVALQVLLTIKSRAAAAAELEAAQTTAAADERASLRAQLADAQTALDAANAAAAEAGARATEQANRAEHLERKLAAQKPNPRRTKTANAPARTKANAPANAQANGVPAQAANAAAGAPGAVPIGARKKARELWDANHEISGKELGEAVGMGPRWGQLRRAEFEAEEAAGQSVAVPEA